MSPDGRSGDLFEQSGALVRVFRRWRAELPRGWVGIAIGSLADVVVERERLEAVATRSRDLNAEDDSFPSFSISWLNRAVRRSSSSMKT
jgi:hypothetical protein